MVFKTIRAISIVVLTPLWFSVSNAFGLAEAGEEEYLELKGAVVFERMTPDDKIREAAVDVYYREALKLRIEDIPAYKSATKLPVGASDDGFVNQFLPGFVFIEVGGGAETFGLCAIYKPELDNVGAEEHKYFPQYWPHERSVDLPMSEKYLLDIAGLFEVYPELNKAEKAVAISRIVFYIFYWDVMYGLGGYFFGDNPDGIYIVTDPLTLLKVPAFIALDRSESFRPGRSTRYFISDYPKGQPPNESYAFFNYTVYTWDLITRRLILWYFSGNYKDEIAIKQIVIGEL
jgi:hypothetical protein